MKRGRRWHRLGPFEFKLGHVRGEWWIGARSSFAMDSIMIGVLGLCVVIARWRR
jgi:hypothetical protein